MDELSKRLHEAADAAEERNEYGLAELLTEAAHEIERAVDDFDQISECARLFIERHSSPL